MGRSQESIGRHACQLCVRILIQWIRDRAGFRKDLYRIRGRLTPHITVNCKNISLISFNDFPVCLQASNQVLPYALPSWHAMMEWNDFVHTSFLLCKRMTRKNYGKGSRGSKSSGRRKRETGTFNSTDCHHGSLVLLMTSDLSACSDCWSTLCFRSGYMQSCGVSVKKPSQ